MREILKSPDEVYEGIRPNDNAKVTVYVKEMIRNGNEVVVFALVVDGVLITSFVPSVGEDAAPAGSEYEQAYDRGEAIEYIAENVLKTATGQATMEKIEEFNRIIERYKPGEEITDG